MLDLMELGIHFPDYTIPGEPATIAPTLAAAARTADDAGYALFTVMDHWFQMESFRTAEDPMLEGYTSLGFVAALTQRIELGLLVTGVTYRHPGLLAKIVTTLDVLSGGRAVLGIGAAWYEREHLGLGVPYPPVAERFERLDETLRICRQMWSDDDGPFDGRHYQLAETLCRPQPIRRPHPPILIGGGGERKTLRLVAEHGDACNLFSSGVDEVAHKIDVLARHCDDVGRDRAEIAVTMLAAFGAERDVDAFVAEMAGYAQLGVSRVSVMPTGDDPVGIISMLGEQLIPRLAELGPR